MEGVGGQKHFKKKKFICNPAQEPEIKKKATGKQLKPNNKNKGGSGGGGGNTGGDNVHGNTEVGELTVNDNIGSSATQSSLAKLKKYQLAHVVPEKQFCGFAIEAGGHWSGAALKLVKQIAKAKFNLTKRHEDYTNTLGNICQRTAVALQRGVAHGLMACLRNVPF